MKENVVDKKRPELKLSDTLYQQFPFDVVDIFSADHTAALLSYLQENNIDLPECT